MSKVISINRTPGDYIKATRHLSLEERGAYQDILDFIVDLGQDANPPSLPDDDRALAAMVGASVAKWRAIKARLTRGPLAVLIVENGRVSQHRIVDEIEAARTRIAGSSKAGVASGEARRKRLREQLSNAPPPADDEPPLGDGTNGRSTRVQRERERNSNGSRSSHESRVTSHESREESSKATPPAPSSQADGGSAADLIDRTLAVIAPHLSLDEFTVARLLRDVHPHPDCLAAMLCQNELRLAAARSAAYAVAILERAPEWPCQTLSERLTPQEYVAYCLDPQRRARMAALVTAAGAPT